MQAIKVQIYFSEWEKVSDFISEINIDEEMAAYAIDNRTMVESVLWPMQRHS